jgi:hypothetical protein
MKFFCKLIVKILFRPKFFANITLLIFSVVIVIYCVEAVLRFGINYLPNSLLEFYKKNKNVQGNIVLRISPVIFIKDQNDIQPLSGFSNSMTIVCNENGYYKKYNSDNYGFANDNSVWSEKIIDFVIIGDSYAQGECVEERDSISGHLRHKSNVVLNLAIGGNGPLLSLATLKEYIPHLNTKNILYIFNVEDLQDLNEELKNNNLKKYLLQEDYSQNLFFKQNEVDIFLKNYFEKNFNDFFSSAERSSFLNFLRLASLRSMLSSKIYILQNRYKPKEILQNNINSNYHYMEKTLISLNNISLKNNSKLYFIYVPTHFDYFSNKNYEKNTVIEIAKKLNIETIDLSNFILKKYKKPESIYSLSLKGWGHPHEKGYQIISNEIIKNIKK